MPVGDRPKLIRKNVRGRTGARAEGVRRYCCSYCHTVPGSGEPGLSVYEELDGSKVIVQEGCVGRYEAAPTTRSAPIPPPSPSPDSKSGASRERRFDEALVRARRENPQFA